MGKKGKNGTSLIVDNRKARHDYNIHETYEAGIALTGTEVKSIRAGRLNLKDSFAALKTGKCFYIKCILVPMNRVINLIMSQSEHVSYLCIRVKFVNF